MLRALSHKSQSAKLKCCLQAKTLYAWNGARARGQSLHPSLFIVMLHWSGLWYPFPQISPMCTRQRGPWRMGSGIFPYALPSPSHERSVDDPFFQGVQMALSSKTHLHDNQHEAVPFSLLLALMQGRMLSLSHLECKWSFLEFLRRYLKNWSSEKRHWRKEEGSPPLTEFSLCIWWLVFAFREVSLSVPCRRTSCTTRAIVLNTRGWWDCSADKDSCCQAGWPKLSP